MRKSDDWNQRNLSGRSGAPTSDANRTETLGASSRPHDTLPAGAIRRAGHSSPTIIPIVRPLWTVLPETPLFWKTIDILAGLITGAQAAGALR